MGKKREQGRGKREEAAEKVKPIFGSGADVEQLLKDDGFVKCVCTVACAWRGYHDEGDKVFIKMELLESDPFFKGHFKALEPLPEGQRRQDGETDENCEGTQSQATEHDGDADGGSGDADGGSETADGGNGQGELGLK